MSLIGSNEIEQLGDNIPKKKLDQWNKLEQDRMQKERDLLSIQLQETRKRFSPQTMSDQEKIALAKKLLQEAMQP